MNRALAPRLPGFLASCGLGLAARLVFIAWTSPVLGLAQDEQRFWDLAGSRMAGTAFLPPLYPIFLAAVRRIVGDDIGAVRVVGACLSVASILLVGLLAERHLGTRAGAAAAFAMALLPTPIYFDTHLRSESLTILLLLTLAWLWTSPGEGRARWRPLAAGVVSGLIGLVKPEFLLFPALQTGFEAARCCGRAGFIKGALLLPGALLVILPWSVRNHQVIGGSVLISANGGYNFWKSFNPESDGSQVNRPDFSIWDAVAERDYDRFGYGEGLRFIRDHPVRSCTLGLRKLAFAFGPEEDFAADLRRQRYPARARPLDIGLAILANFGWFALLGAGAFGLLGAKRSPVKDTVLAALLTLVLVHLVFFGDGRFHVPLIPFLCVALPEAWDGVRRDRRAVLTLAVGMAALGVFSLWFVAREWTRVRDLWNA